MHRQQWTFSKQDLAVILGALNEKVMDVSRMPGISIEQRAADMTKLHDVAAKIENIRMFFGDEATHQVVASIEEKLSTEEQKGPQQADHPDDEFTQDEFPF
jgi:hypothetical protein